MILWISGQQHVLRRDYYPILADHSPDGRQRGRSTRTVARPIPLHMVSYYLFPGASYVQYSSSKYGVVVCMHVHSIVRSM